MLIVTGATGQLGRGIVEQLLKRMPAAKIGVSVRDPAKAKDLAGLGVRVRQGDFEDASSLRDAFEGVSQLLLVSSNARAFGGDPIAQHRTAIQAAREAGARRVVYTSQIASGPGSAFNPAVDHASTEALLNSAGVLTTSLRNGFYATHAAGMLTNALKNGELVAPAAGKFSWTAHADLAEAAAVILCDEGKFNGPTPPLTASEAFDLPELCNLASEITGKKLACVTLSDDEYRARMIKNGMPEKAANFAIGMFAASRNGEFAAVDPTLEQLVGHRPTRLREILSAKLAG